MGIETVQELLPAGSKVLLLEDFVREYAPNEISSLFPQRARKVAAVLHSESAAKATTGTTTEMEWVKQTGDRSVSSAGFLPEELRRMIVAPLKTCRILRQTPGSGNNANNANHYKSTASGHCRKPVRTLVDDVVYSLVHRHERLRRIRKYQRKRALSQGRRFRPSSLSSSSSVPSSAPTKQPGATILARNKANDDASTSSDYDEDDGRNVLVRGFAISREGDGPPPLGMKSGISYRHPNENVTFWKSSPIVRRLHELVGDEVLRMMLLHTRCFLPILSHGDAAKASGDERCRDGDDGDGGDDDGKQRAATGRKWKRKRKRIDSNGEIDDAKGNYILLCGPPICNAHPNQHRALASVTSSATNNSARKRKRETGDPGTSTNTNTNSNGMQCKTSKKKRRCFSNGSLGRHDPQLRANENISRHSLMYCDAYIPRVTLSKSHPFRQRIERLKAASQAQMENQSVSLREGTGNNPQPQRPKQQPDNTNDDFHFVLNVVFELHLENKNKQRRIRKRLGGSGRMVCERLWKNFSTGNPCQNYGRLLERYCGLPKAYLEERKSASSALVTDDNERLAKLSRAFTSKEEIVSFLGSVLRKAFPVSFWGSERNFQSVMASVRFFVRLRRDERLTNKTILHGISVTDMTWLYPSDANAGEASQNNGGRDSRKPNRKRNRKQRTNHATATELTLKALRWVFRGFIIPLLRSAFYVTETEFSAKEIQYYRKPVWSLFRAISLRKVTTMAAAGNGNTCVMQKHFAILSQARARKILGEQIMGLSRLRFLPKSTGMRPISDLSRSASIRFPPTTATSASTLTASKSALVTSTLLGISTVAASRNNSKKRTRAGELLHPQDNTGTTSKMIRLGNKAPAEPKSSFSRLPTNVILEKVLDVLKYECDQRERPFGNGIDNLHHFYKRYRDYISDIKQQQHVNDQTNAKMQLFFAKVDIEKCYDRINQDYLLNLVQELVLHNTYVIQKVKQDSAPIDGSRNSATLRKSVETIDEYESFHSREHALAQRNRNTVFDLVKCTLAERKTILDLLEEHLLRHTVVTSGRHDRKMLLQCSGISQGSTLSMLLCNIYYGRVEKLMFGRNDRHLSRAPGQSDREETGMDMMFRFVDDFLFISPNSASFQRFLDRTYLGKSELGARINPKKTLANVKSSVRVTHQDGRTTDIPVSQSNRINRNGSVLFPWCGMLFDTEKGEVFVDYERFQDGKVRDSMTIEYTGNEGRKMVDRMRTFVHPRCIPLLYDSRINSFETSAFNYYQMMLFAACKTAEYMRGHAVCNNAHILRCIRDLPRFACFTIRRRFEYCSPNETDFGTVFLINGYLASALSWNAFCDVFSYISGFAVMTRRLREETMASFGHISCRSRQQIPTIVSRALDDFRIHHMIER